MELRQLEYFVRIADTGSINEAARKLNMSQPPAQLFASTARRRARGGAVYEECEGGRADRGGQAAV